MKYLAIMLSALIFSSAAHAAPPSEASIDKLIEVSQAMEAVKSIQQQIDGMLKNTMQQAMQGQAVTPDQQKVLDAYQQKIKSIALEQIDPEHMKSMYLQLYQDNFSQEEIDQLIAFYESPTGKMFASKMPVVMQKSMATMQQRIGPMMKKMQQATQDMEDQLGALKQNAAK